MATMTLPETKPADPTARVCQAWNDIDPALRAFNLRNAPGKQDDYWWFLEWLMALESDDVFVAIDRKRSTGTLEEVVVPFEDAPAGARVRLLPDRVDGLLAAPFVEVREVIAVTARHPNGRPARYRPIARIAATVDVNYKDRRWSDETVLIWVKVGFEPVVTELSVDERGDEEATFVIGVEGRPVMVFDEDALAFVPLEG